MSLVLRHIFVSVRCFSRSAVAGFIIAVALSALLAGTVHAQTTTSTTDKMTPSGISPGAPAGSYALSGFESINLFNGNLDFRLPLITLGGRGSAQRAIMLSLNTKKWRVREQHTETSDTYTPTTANWNNINVGYSAGKLQGRQSGHNTKKCTNPNQTRFWYTVTRLTFVTPDGTEYDLRDQLTDGQPMVVTNYCSSSTVGASRGTVFKTKDGSGATFISDTTINDKTSLPLSSTGSWNLNVSGYLILSDGTRYRIDGGNVSWIRDRNGNLIYSQQDAIGRTVGITTSADGSEDQLTYKGFGGAVRTIRVTRTSMGNVLRAGFSLRTHSQLFPELNGAFNYGSALYNPTVVSAVILPDGRSYRFYYNSYGELARVELPTGGAIEYDMNAGSGVVSNLGIYGDEKQIYRRVIERRTYVNGTTLTGRTTYAESGQLRTVDNLTPAGTLLSREKHYFSGDAAQSLFAPVEGTFYSDWREGKETATEYLAADGVTVLRRVSNTWEQRAPVSWYPSQYANGSNEPANDPRLTQTVTTLVDTNQVSKQTFLYDQYNNQTEMSEYDYGTGTAGALLRRTHTDYLTTNPINGLDYTANTIHIRNLATQTSVYDANGVEQARTTHEYDNYAPDANHASLLDRPGIIGLDTTFTTAYQPRGNITCIKRWLLPANIPLSSYQQYDIAGNVVKVIDARSFATTFDYSDRFGSPDGAARTNSPPSELGAQSSYAFVTSATNALGQSVYGQYDYYLGRPVDGEDLNGIVATGIYNDVLDRPTQVISALGTAEQKQTTFAYDDTSRIITTTSDLNNYADNLLKSEVVYDGLGRTVETRIYESSVVYIAAKQLFDALGRASQASNPYRPTQGESPVWTTTNYDGLGRVISVTTPDNAVSTTAYSGNQTTVTDQALKSRRSVSDALGRLTTVFEDPNSLNYQTSYVYDVLDNLRTVVQGSQTRSFAYDSLSRLSSVTNPENGTVSYQYDSGSNLTQVTDARSVTTTLSYDALNRITSKSYNDGTPSVAYFYDAQSLPAGAPSFDRGYAIGRLVAVTYGGSSAGNYGGYNSVGHTIRQVQQTDSINYLVEATYNKAGALKTETYPSVPGHGDRRVVTYDYDFAGRPSTMTTAATSYAAGANAIVNSYAPHGSIMSETYGNGLVHALNYNSRLQTTEIKLGTSGNPTSILSLGYDYGTTSNNGNVNNITYSGGGLSYTQSFSYDPLNRLSTAQETSNGSGSWSQTNGYDRYGNRWMVLGGGTPSQSFDGNNRIIGRSYDAAGNLLNDGAHGYGYDAESRVASVDGVAAYRYDGEGRRVRKLIGENLRFIYDMTGQMIAEFDGATGALRKEYVHGASGIIATIEPANGAKYITSDHLGSPRAITNSSGGVVSRHDYMPFGEELFAGTGGRTTAMGYSATDGLRQKFTGKERDGETGLDYFIARYYSSAQGRFTSTDPLLASGRAASPQSWNRYTYVLNNPVRLVDPNGLDSNDANEQRRQQMSGQQQQQPTPVATQTATLENVPNCHMCFDPIPTTVIIDQMHSPDLGVANVNGTDSLVVGVALRFTFLDQQGHPITNATVVESVEALEGPQVTQASRPVPLNANGEGGDLVSNNSGPVPKTEAQQRAAAKTLNQDFTTSQRLKLTVTTDTGRVVQVTQQRTLTNTAPGAPTIQGVVRGYTFTMEQPKMELIK
jgi:RHS repeat-associated protein